VLAGIFAVVEIPGDDNGADCEGNQDIEGRRNALVGAVGPAKDFRDEEGTVGRNGGGEARHQRSMEGIVEDIGNHAEGGAVDKAGGEKEQQEGTEEHDEVMSLNAHERYEAGSQHYKEGQQRDPGAAIDFIRQPATQGPDAGTDKGP